MPEEFDEASLFLSQPDIILSWDNELPLDAEERAALVEVIEGVSDGQAALVSPSARGMLPLAVLGIAFGGIAALTGAVGLVAYAMCKFKVGVVVDARTIPVRARKDSSLPRGIILVIDAEGKEHREECGTELVREVLAGALGLLRAAG